MLLRHSLRSLARSPGFTATAVLTLALGIGATTAIFGVIDVVMLRPLDYREPERLVRVWETTPRGDDFVASDPNYLDFREQNRSFEALAAFKQASLSLTGRGEPRRLEGMAITHDLFPLLGVQPQLGRGFQPEEDRREGDARVVLLGHALWTEQFGGVRSILGTTITLNRTPYTVVGVMPAEVEFPAADVWIPLAPDPARDRDEHWLDMVGRLRPGVSIEQAAADLNAIAATFGEYEPVVADWGARVEPFARWLVGPGFRRTMLVLFGGVGCLLLIGCLNLANLLLARATSRQGEIGVRAALGAGRGRIAVMLLTESVVIALAGSVLGLLAASWALELLVALSPAGVPRLNEVTVDGRVVAFAVTLALVTAILFGLAPAVAASRFDLAPILRGARTSFRAHTRMRAVLVVTQIAFATVLLVGAGLLLRSFLRLQGADPGFDPVSLASVPLQLDDQQYAEEWRRVVFIDQVVERLNAVPGVESASATAVGPFSDWNLVNDVTPAERAAEVGPSGLLQAGWRAVTPGFFGTMGIPLLRGRGFSADDPWDGPPLAIVSATLAERLWPGQDAVGKRVFWGGTDGEPRTVIGVVGDFHDVNMQADPMPLLFLPNNQIAWPAMTLVIRFGGDPARMAAAVRDAIHEVDPLLPVPEIRPLERSVASVTAGPRFRSLLLTAFALLALLLASIGVYGVTAFGVARRTREFGVRLALGATPATLSQMVLRGGLSLALAGLAVGVVLAWALSRFLGALLYDTSPTDPATFAGVVAVLGGVSLLASYLPGRRAGRTDPAVALREEG